MLKLENIKSQAQPAKNVETVKNKEEVRIYRLSLLEENQIKILTKIEELEEKLDIKYDKELSKHDKRLLVLEKRNATVDKFIWLVIMETIALVFVFIQKFLGG